MRVPVLLHLVGPRIGRSDVFHTWRCSFAIPRPFTLSCRAWLSTTTTTAPPRPSHRCTFPLGGYEKIPVEVKIEEETLPYYEAHEFYPVRLGEIFDSRYQVVAKLGYGTESTTWLCRDLQTASFLALKVCTIEQKESTMNNEIAVSQHIRAIDPDGHPGRDVIRLVVDDFQIKGPHGLHRCLLLDPLGMSLADFAGFYQKGWLTTELLQLTMVNILAGLDFLHQAGVVHTDLSPNNIMLGIRDASIISDVASSELKHPSPRKELPDRVIHCPHSHPMPISAMKPPIICDFGHARIGDRFSGTVMPRAYRAPEVIMGMEWDSKIDIWSVGVMIWDIFEGGQLMHAMGNGHSDDEQHLAQTVSLIGNPPREFLKRSQKCRQYWDDEGNWIAATPIPDQSLKTREVRLKGKEQEFLLAFVQKLLCWLPDQRPTGQDMLDHEFIEMDASQE